MMIKQPESSPYNHHHNMKTREIILESLNIESLNIDPETEAHRAIDIADRLMTGVPLWPARDRIVRNRGPRHPPYFYGEGEPHTEANVVFAKRIPDRLKSLFHPDTILPRPDAIVSSRTSRARLGNDNSPSTPYTWSGEDDSGIYSESGIYCVVGADVRVRNGKVYKIFAPVIVYLHNDGPFGVYEVMDGVKEQAKKISGGPPFDLPSEDDAEFRQLIEDVNLSMMIKKEVGFHMHAYLPT